MPRWTKGLPHGGEVNVNDTGGKTEKMTLGQRTIEWREIHREMEEMAVNIIMNIKRIAKFWQDRIEIIWNRQYKRKTKPTPFSNQEVLGVSKQN